MTTPADGTPSAGPAIANCSPGVSTACTAVEVPKSKNAAIKLPIIFFTEIPLRVNVGLQLSEVAASADVNRPKQPCFYLFTGPSYKKKWLITSSCSQQDMLV